MGEGAGGGEDGHLKSFPPHLNPLPPGERRYFLCDPNDPNRKPQTEPFGSFFVGDLELIWNL